MTEPKASITVAVDPANPGQFFACCGLLELADHLWPGAEAWFAADGRAFKIACAGSLSDLLKVAQSVTIAGLNDDSETEDTEDEEDGEDDALTPVELVAPVALRLDWWSDKSIKTWAGSMNVHLIAVAMSRAIDAERPDPFSQCQVVYDPPKKAAIGAKRRSTPCKKREPFYFDTQRGPNAHSRDVGFSPNDLKLTTTASPAVEFHCLIGLQRCRPKTTSSPRVFDYFTWTIPFCLSVIPAAVSGLLPFAVGKGYRFKNAFRSGQEKLKAYMPAIPIPPEGD